jgi:DNA polymerase
MLEPLREDFKKLREFLDRQAKPVKPTEAITTPEAPTQQIDQSQPAQMDLFGT